MTPRDRRALTILAVAAIVMLAYAYWPQPAPETVGGTADSAMLAQRLDRFRREAAQLPARAALRDAARAELVQLEKGLIPGDSSAQAQANLLAIVRRVARAQSPPLDLRQADSGQLRPFTGDYAQLLLNTALECQIEQLVNFLADLAAQPELLAIEELHVTATSNKQKTIPVRLTISGLARGALLKQVRGAF